MGRVVQALGGLEPPGRATGAWSAPLTSSFAERGGTNCSKDVSENEVCRQEIDVVRELRDGRHLRGCAANHVDLVEDVFARIVEKFVVETEVLRAGDVRTRCQDAVRAERIVDARDIAADIDLVGVGLEIFDVVSARAVGEDEGVPPGPAGEVIVPRAADDEIVAGAAGELIVASSPISWSLPPKPSRSSASSPPRSVSLSLRP